MRRAGGNVPTAAAKRPKALVIDSKIDPDAETEGDAVKDDEEDEVSENDADLDDDDDVAPDELGVSVGKGDHEG